MIVSNIPVVIEAVNERSGIVYIETVGRTEPIGTDLVIMHTRMYTLDTSRVETRKVKVSKGFIDEPIFQHVPGQEDPVPTGETQRIERFEFEDKRVCFPRLVFEPNLSREAKFKASTYYKRFKDVTPEASDDAMLAQIDFLKTYEWTGQELQRVGFWGLSASDFRKISAEEREALEQPYIVD